MTFIHSYSSLKNSGVIHETSTKKVLDPGITHEKNFGSTKAQWHETQDGKRPTEFSTLRLNDVQVFYLRILFLQNTLKYLDSRYRLKDA